MLRRVRNAVYDDPRYHALRAAVLHEWVGKHGWWCPGYEVPAHEAHDLSLDHTRPLSAGGAPFDRANASVLCGACNSRKGGARRLHTYAGGGSNLAGHRVRPRTPSALRTTAVEGRL